MKKERTEINYGRDTAPWGPLCFVVYGFIICMVGCTIKNELKNRPPVVMVKPPLAAEVIVCRDTNGPIDWRTWDKK